jgi:hypothetical protein
MPQLNGNATKRGAGRWLMTVMAIAISGLTLSAAGATAAPGGPVFVNSEVAARVFGPTVDWPFDTCYRRNYRGGGLAYYYDHSDFDGTNRHWKNWYFVNTGNNWAGCYE